MPAVWRTKGVRRPATNPSAHDGGLGGSGGSAVQPPRGHNLDSVSRSHFLVKAALPCPMAREALAGGWLTLQLDYDLILILMPDQKRRDVVKVRDGF